MKFDYDEISPITGNKCVLVEDIGSGVEQKICMESGYMTMSIYHESNDQFEVLENNIPDMIVAKKVVDDLGFNWYLTVLNTEQGCLTPIPSEDDPNGFKWMVSQYIDTLEVDENGSAKKRLDVENAEVVSSDKFEYAQELLAYIINTKLNESN